MVQVEITPELLEAFRTALKKDHPDVDIDAQLKQGGEEGLTERTLTRWLRARKGDVSHAVKELVAHAAWRVQHVPEGMMTKDRVMTHIAMKSAWLPGVDKYGHPALIARVRSHTVCKNHEDFVNWMIYTLDGGIMKGLQEEARTGRAWDGKLIGLLDLQGMGLSNCDSSGLLTIFNLLQHHYVERLHSMYLYCAPTIFYGLWAVVSPFVDPVTRKKVHFVSAKEAAVIFDQDFEPGVLPPELQGTGPERCLPDEVDKMHAAAKLQAQAPPALPAAPGASAEQAVAAST